MILIYRISGKYTNKKGKGNIPRGRGSSGLGGLAFTGTLRRASRSCRVDSEESEA